jgi:hypothetical protein
MEKNGQNESERQNSSVLAVLLAKRQNKIIGPGSVIFPGPSGRLKRLHDSKLRPAVWSLVHRPLVLASRQTHHFLSNTKMTQSGMPRIGGKDASGCAK